MRSIATIVFTALLFSVSSAQPPKGKGIPDSLPRIAPRPPAEAVKLFEVHPAFRMELAAAEPLVMSPVAAEFDEDGRLFVVEAPEYNQYGSKNSHGKGRVAMLEDTDGDGKFDRRTIAVDDLDYPTAVFPWDGGLYVGAAPHLYYCKDGEKKIVLSGFGTDKSGEGHLNSFRWHLDNRILISTGSDGGEITKGPLKDTAAISVRRQNILLDPRNNSFEPTSGGGQHGMSMDDWGNTFVCGNSDPCLHLAYDTRLLAKNPALLAPPPAVNIAPAGKFTKLHRISEVEPWRDLRTRLRKDGVVPGSDEGGQASGFFTGATGITIYRGDAYPPEFRGNAFVGEVANNLVYRAKLTPKGASFVAERADADKEFLASKDIWFRPVQFTQGPDGCLYVIDMYRELIEGAAFLAPSILKHVDPSAGVDKGRIWRIAPKDFKQPTPLKMSVLSSEELVKLLDHSNGWHRDTAARLLFMKQDQKVVPMLKQLAAEGKTPQGRAHALYTLQGLNQLSSKILNQAWADADANVRAHAIQLSIQKESQPSDEVFRERVQDDSPQVRYQLVWFLAELDSGIVGKTLQTLVKRDSADPWMRLAIAYAATSGPVGDDKLDFIGDPELFKLEYGRAFIELLVETAGASKSKETARSALRGISRLRDHDVGYQFHLMYVMMKRASQSTLQMFERDKTARAFYAQLQERARETALDAKVAAKERATAIRALIVSPYADVRDLFPILLKPMQPNEVQVAAMDLLARTGPDDAPVLLIKIWPSLSPAVRATATEVLLSRANWLQLFLDAVESNKIAKADVDPARIALLLKSPNRSVRIRVEDLFGKPTTIRKEVVERYQPALKLKGDPLKGKAIFKKDCAACHKLEDVGVEVGADLKAIRDRGVEGMMLNILDPNREVKPQFLAYSLETANGKTFSGLITAETPNSVTLRLLDGRSETIARADIDTLRSTGLSFMPEGLEKQIDLQAMADLLAYLNSIK